MPRSTAPSPLVSPVYRLLAALMALSLVVVACAPPGSGASGPTAPGQYEVQGNSIAYDGERYSLQWVDKGGQIRSMQARGLKMVRDERTFLEKPEGGAPVLHLKEDQAVQVHGRDGQGADGAFTSSWFPFFLGYGLAGGFGGGRDTVVINQPAPGVNRAYGAGEAAYRYPPTDSFGRGESLHGSVDSASAQAPDYKKVQPQPYATSAQSAGTGGGNAATNKSAVPGGATRPDAVAPAGNAASAQSGGAGGGTAASAKGGFASGASSYESKVGRGGATGGGAGVRPAQPADGNKGIGGSGTGSRAPAPARAGRR